jgi:uncharacterized protein YjiS (DUF1127 family)
LRKYDFSGANSAPGGNSNTARFEKQVTQWPALALPCREFRRRRLLVFTRFTRRLRSWQQDRAMIRKLAVLDDRLLADMGITRRDIERFVSDRAN